MQRTHPMIDLTPEQIAAGLSQNMRDALLSNRVASDGSRWMNFSTTLRTRRALIARGLLDDGPLTPLGLQVRAILQEPKP